MSTIRVIRVQGRELSDADLAEIRQWRGDHPVWLVETFVDPERFAGTAYKAAGWIHVGQTTGRTRQDRDRTLQAPIKTVWVRPLCSQFQTRLTAR